MLPHLIGWHITLIVIGALALVISEVIMIIGMMLSCHRTGELHQLFQNCIHLIIHLKTVLGQLQS